MIEQQRELELLEKIQGWIERDIEKLLNNPEFYDDKGEFKLDGLMLKLNHQQRLIKVRIQELTRGK